MACGLDLSDNRRVASQFLPLRRRLTEFRGLVEHMRRADALNQLPILDVEVLSLGAELAVASTFVTGT